MLSLYVKITKWLTIYLFYIFRMLFLQVPHICKMESDKTALHVLLENTNEVLIVVHTCNSKHALPIKIAYLSKKSI